MSEREKYIRFKMMANGNIRGYQSNTYDKRGVSELQIISSRNESPTITTAHEIKIYLIYETI